MKTFSKLDVGGILNYEERQQVTQNNSAQIKISKHNKNKILEENIFLPSQICWYGLLIYKEQA